ncbi:MAG: hypothetical protein AAF499_16325, partial [Pseudomonadota bacterium]
MSSTSALATDEQRSIASYHVKTLDRDTGYVYRNAPSEETREEKHGRIRGAWFYSAKNDPITRKSIIFAEKLAPDHAFYESKHLGIRVFDIKGKAQLVCVLGHGHDALRATISVDDTKPVSMSKNGCISSESLVNAL